MCRCLLYPIYNLTLNYMIEDQEQLVYMFASGGNCAGNLTHVNWGVGKEQAGLRGLAGLQWGWWV